VDRARADVYCTGIAALDAVSGGVFPAFVEAVVPPGVVVGYRLGFPWGELVAFVAA
jgi:hypothetical protein